MSYVKNEFVYEEFCLKYEKNIKTRTFLEYLENKYGGLDKRNVLANLSEEDILNSLAFYINTGIEYQITANNYFTYITSMFNELSNIYNIKNILFVDKTRYENLAKRIKNEVKSLKESSLKEIASEDEFRSLQNEVEEIAKQICEKAKNNRSNLSKEHKKLVSLIATNLVLDYGLKGDVVSMLNVDDYQNEENILKVNGIVLRLNDKYRMIMDLYLESRQEKLNKNNINATRLLINTHGKEFVKYENGSKKCQPDYGSIFTIAKELTGSAAINKFAYNRIIKMIDHGVDVSTIENLTGFSLENTIKRLLEYYNDEIRKLNPEQYFFKRENSNMQFSIDGEKEEYMKCPVCERLVSSKATEWVVVLYEGEQIPMLSCKYCGGVDEEDYI